VSAAVLSPAPEADAWARLQRSLLWRAGGVVRAQLLDAWWLAALCAEADVQHAEATEPRSRVPAHEDTRRGDPARWLETAPGGPVLAAFLAAPATLALLREVTGLPFVPSGPQGTYSYYRRAGHHLDVHRDIDVCDLAVITCLRDEGASADARGLEVYPSRWGEPTSQVRRSAEVGAQPITVAPGESAVLLGGVVPHRVPPLGAGRIRVVTPLCYRVAT
jgi:hypothetical protein